MTIFSIPVWLYLIYDQKLWKIVALGDTLWNYVHLESHVEYRLTVTYTEECTQTEVLRVQTLACYKLKPDG